MPNQESKKRNALVFGLVFIMAVLTQALTFTLIPDGQLNDDAAYVLRAMKLAFPHRFDFLRSAPTDYPFGWPLVLVPFYWLSDQFYTIGRLVAVVLTGLTSMLLFSIFKDKTNSGWTAAGIVLLFLHSPRVMMLGSSLMTEPFCYFLILLSVFLFYRTRSTEGFLLLGLLGAWCMATRMEGLALVLAMLVSTWRVKGLKSPFFAYLGGFLTTTLALRLLLADANQQSRLFSVFSFFKDKSTGELLGYPFFYLKHNSFHALASVFGELPSLFVIVLFLLPTAGVLRLKAGPARALSQAAKDPLLLWIFIYPAIIAPWPYFTSRYWALWTVVALSLALTALPIKARTAALSLLLVLQIPSAVESYRLGPISSRFQKEIYLPFYRSLGQARRVMTLHSTRVATLSFVATEEPLWLKDFQSLPIGMAYKECDVIEWEVSDRNIKTYTGEQARPFPPQALEGLRRSRLFEPYQTSPFAEAFRLTADPLALKQAGSLYSQALQSDNLQERKQLLEQALNLVDDLPETRRTYAETLLALNPEDPKGMEILQALYEQYPYLEESLQR